MTNESAGKCKLRLDTSFSTTNGLWITDATCVNLGEWSNVVVTWNDDSPDNQPKFYVNGELIASSEDSSGPAGTYDSDAARDLLIGNEDSGVKTFHGVITEVSLWSTIFSAANVALLYNDGLAIDCLQHPVYLGYIGFLEGYWRNNGLATWTDLRGNGNNGTVNNLTETMLITAGADGSRDSQGFLMNSQRDTNCLNHPLIGYDDVLVDSVGSTNLIVPEFVVDYDTSGFTCCFWFKSTDMDEPRFCISHQETGNYGKGFHVRIGATNIVVFVVGDGDTDDYYTVSSNNTFVDGTWHHVIASYNPSTSITLYMDNGVQTITDSVSEDGGAVGDVSPSTFLNVGTRRDPGTGSDQQMVGQIDDVLLYTKQLSVTERTRIYNAGKRSHR